MQGAFRFALLMENSFRRHGTAGCLIGALLGNASMEGAVPRKAVRLGPSMIFAKTLTQVNGTALGTSETAMKHHASGAGIMAMVIKAQVLISPGRYRSDKISGVMRD